MWQILWKCKILAWSALHAIELGFRTVLIEDACMGIDPQGVIDTFEKIKEGNGLVVNSREVFYIAKSKISKVVHSMRARSTHF